MQPTPLLVHVLFHPDSPARELAREIHRALNEDPAVPSLHIPTVFAPEPGGGAPPERLELDAARTSFVVLLADDHLVVDDDWCRFAGDTAERLAAHPEHRFLPVQLSEAAWPLDDRMGGTGFLRAFAADGAVQVQRRLLIELCRALRGIPGVDLEGRAPIQLFLSHTKLDLEREPHVFEALKDHMTRDQPVDAWIDSGDIGPGSEFAGAIENGVADATLLCLLTDRYASREWCRKEVLLAKEKARPAAVIDALDAQEVRSFPYLGNLPVLRWRGDPAAAIDLAVKETVRHLHAIAILERHRAPADVVFSRAPELATLVGLPADSHVLYPDPPLGVEEVELLERTGVEVSTPLERMARQRSLAGRAIALSASESTDLAAHGLDPLHLEECMVDLSRCLLIQGATLAHGGHLGSAGYTEKLFELVRAHDRRAGGPAFERIVNYVGWPIPKPDVHVRSAKKTTARIPWIERPAGVDETLHPDLVPEPPAFFPGDRSEPHRYAWARGMTAMRAAQTADVAARVVLGGTFGPTTKAQADGSVKESWYFGCIPGVLEEILISARAEQPVFLVGAFGGVAGLVVDLLEGRDRPEATWEYQRRAPFAEELKARYGDEWESYEDLVAELRARDPERMVALILAGLERLP